VPAIEPGPSIKAHSYPEIFGDRLLERALPNFTVAEAPAKA